MSLTNCRFYEEKFPEIDSFVMVTVKQVNRIPTFLMLAEREGGNLTMMLIVAYH